MQKLTGDTIDYTPSFEIEEGFYGLTQDSFDSSIKFFEHHEKKSALNDYEKVLRYEYHEVHEDAVIYHGAYAIFQALSKKPAFKFLTFAYKWIPLFSVISEAGYRMVARNRMHISRALGVDACKIN